MRTGPPTGLLCLLLAAAVLIAGCSGPGTAGQNPTPSPTATGPQRMTTGELAEMVKDAASSVQLAGEQAALAEFSRKDGVFSHGDVYVYACGFNGTLLAHPYQPSNVGKNRENFTDIRGLPVIRVSNYTASQGGGFVTYLYPAPSGGIINESAPETYVPKVGYVCPAGPDLWVASGLYFSELAGADPEPQAVGDMMALVQNAAEFGKNNDRNTSFAEISNRSGQFVDASGHYVYAYDYNGTLLAHPYLPNLVGTSLIGRKDAFGMENIRALCDTARSGGGYVVFIWPNPDAGNKEEMKIGYVLPVDDTWWVGSGAYLDEITGVYSFYPPHPV